MMVVLFVLRLVLIFNMCLFNMGYCNSFQIKKLCKIFKIIKESRLSGHVMSTFNASSSFECATACTHEMSCISYNLIKDNGVKICELNSNGLDDVFVADARSTYSGLYIFGLLKAQSGLQFIKCECISVNSTHGHENSLLPKAIAANGKVVKQESL